MYVQNSEDKTAYFGTYNKTLDSYTEQVFNDSYEIGSIKNTNTGRVVVRVAIHPSGRSEFLAVISSTHPDLVPLAQRIASGSRFTSPTRQGKAVKVVMSWPIIIKKWVI